MLLTCLLYVTVVCVYSVYVGKSPREVDVKTVSAPNCNDAQCKDAEFFKTAHSARAIRHSCECIKDRFAWKRRLIAEAIVELVEDELGTWNLETRYIDAFTDRSRDKIGTNSNRIYCEERLIKSFVDKMLQTKKWSRPSGLLTNFPRKRKKLWHRQRASDETTEDGNITKEAVDVVDNIVNSDVLVDEFGLNITAEEKLNALNLKTGLIFSDEALGPFRGIFLSHFNTGFADFGNHLGVPQNLDKEPSPVHVLECSSVRSGSSSSSSFCDDNLCTVRCQDGSQVQLHCQSNTVSVSASSGQGKYSYQVTCGTSIDGLD